MLMLGCDGGTHASSNAVPEVTRRMYDLCRAGNYEEAMKWHYRILELFDAMLYPFEFPDGFRAAAELRGFNFGARPPAPDRRAAGRPRPRWLTCCSASWPISSWSLRPPAGCAPRIRQPEQDKVEQVVFEVMRELEKRGVI